MFDFIPRKAVYVLIGLVVLILAMAGPAYMAKGYSDTKGTKTVIPRQEQQKKAITNSGTMYYPIP